MPDTVFVPLLNEGSDVWRPAIASVCGVNLYRLSEVSVDDEEWAFPPGAVVYCESRLFSDGTTGLVAVALAEPSFPFGPIDELGWFCPAVQKVISEGLCREYCFADSGGPTDSAASLKAWIAKSGTFPSLSAFHEICGGCPHCQWSHE